MINSTLYLQRAMNQTSADQSIAPPESQNLSPPAESIAPSPESILEPVAATDQVPHEILEWGDDRFYAQHWGINE